ncbi:MAG: hypothetical protein QM714_05940 [Nocardioides sp.]|uniref:hypothetical protein n=1 Tax=Nocardioides sp. TaxID=35761 RepID=UPI0039E71808
MTGAGGPPEGLLEEADGLYALPLGEFTSVRDARAKEVKGTDAALATAVKALRKPTVAAWVVNLLVRRDSDQVEQILTVGAALREAQASLDGSALRELTRQRRLLTSAVTARARTLAAEDGQRITDTVAEQVEATLTAAMLDETAAQTLRSGLLVAPLRATGLGAAEVGPSLAIPGSLGFTATSRAEGSVDGDGRGSAPTLSVIDGRAGDDAGEARAARRAREQSRREAKEALLDARAAFSRAQRARKRAVAEVDELEATALRLASEIDELRRRTATLEAETEDNDERLGDAREALAGADEELAAAESAQDEAEAHLDSLD